MLKKLVCIKLVIADGLDATEKMISTLIRKKFYFEMRFYANRVVEYHRKSIGINQIKDLEPKGKNLAKQNIGLFTSPDNRQEKNKLKFSYKI